MRQTPRLLTRLTLGVLAAFVSIGFVSTAAHAEAGQWTTFPNQNNTNGTAEYRVEPTCAPPTVTIASTAALAGAARTAYLATISVYVPNPVPAPPEPNSDDYASEEEYIDAYLEWMNYPQNLYFHTQTIENLNAGAARKEESFTVPLDAFEFDVEPNVYVAWSVSFFDANDVPIVAPQWSTQVSLADLEEINCGTVLPPVIVDPPTTAPVPDDEASSVVDVPAPVGAAQVAPDQLAATGAGSQIGSAGLALLLIASGVAAVGTRLRSARARTADSAQG